jgi:hypothetical protein
MYRILIDDTHEMARRRLFRVFFRAPEGMECRQFLFHNTEDSKGIQRDVIQNSKHE